MLGDTWLLISIGLTAVAAAVLVFQVLPGQAKLLDVAPDGAVLTNVTTRLGMYTGIFNLLRNIGGSIGISVAETALVRRGAMHQARIAAAAPQSGYWFEQQTSALGAYLSHPLGHPSAHAAALATLYRRLEQQAMLWSFVDVFRWTALLAFLAGFVA